MTEYPPAASGLEALASALSVAVRIEPELVRAVRLSVLPSLDVGYEADLWFGDYVAAREPGSIVLREDARRRLQGTLRERLYRADRGEPIWQLWQEISRVHAHISPALLLEERITWLAISEGEEAQNEIEAELRGALHALIRQERRGITDWFSGAIRRLPESVQRTNTAWLLRQATQPSETAAVGRFPTSFAGLNVSDLADIVHLLPDVRLTVRRRGSNVEIGAMNPGPGAVAILVPDTSPRIVELLVGTDTSTDHRTVAIGMGETVSMTIGPGPVRIRTARGDVYEIPDIGHSRSERMGLSDDYFWEDLLSHIRQQMLIPVVGPGLTVVNVGDAEQTLTTLVGQRLAKRYQLTVPPGATTGDAVAACLQERGRDELERLYRVINDIITDLDPAPGDSLRDLAAIDDLRLFVSMTPDRLLAKAINEVRFEGREITREFAFSPHRATIKESQAQLTKSETVVLSLFGKAASTPQYAIHEEDQLEWVHALLTDAASLPEWLESPLKHQPMLFIGCELPDWIWPFLLRMFSQSRLWHERDQQFFFVGNSISREPSLSRFFATYCRKTLVQQLDMEPTEFVAELRARWEQQVAATPSPPDATSGPAAPDTAPIFISYMREDADAARRLLNAIRSIGGEVWLDEGRLLPGDAWNPQVWTAIRETVRLFVPVISANTERAEEGYVFREWQEAVDRSRSVMGRRFIVPVIVDNDYAGDPSRYKNCPTAFRDYQFGRAPGGEPDASLLAMLKNEIRAMRRTGAA